MLHLESYEEFPVPVRQLMHRRFSFGVLPSHSRHPDLRAWGLLRKVASLVFLPSRYIFAEFCSSQEACPCVSCNHCTELQFVRGKEALHCTHVWPRQLHPLTLWHHVCVSSSFKQPRRLHMLQTSDLACSLLLQRVRCNHCDCCPQLHIRLLPPQRLCYVHRALC